MCKGLTAQLRAGWHEQSLLFSEPPLTMLSVVAESTGWQAIEAHVDGIVGLIWEFPEAPTVIAHMRAADPGYRPGDQWVLPMVQVTQRAHEEGSLRDDASPTDVAYLPHLLGQLVGWPEPHRGLLLARMRALLLDGLRTTGSRRDGLPVVPLSVEQLRALSEHAPAPTGAPNEKATRRPAPRS